MYVTSSPGSKSIRARATVSPPNPESNMPMARSTADRLRTGTSGVRHPVFDGATSSDLATRNTGCLTPDVPAGSTSSDLATRNTGCLTPDAPAGSTSSDLATRNTGCLTPAAPAGPTNSDLATRHTGCLTPDVLAGSTYGRCRAVDFDRRARRRHVGVDQADPAGRRRRARRLSCAAIPRESLPALLLAEAGAVAPGARAVHDRRLR